MGFAGLKSDVIWGRSADVIHSRGCVKTGCGAATTVTVAAELTLGSCTLVAVNAWVSPGSNRAELGLTFTATGTVTVTCAEADFVESTTLVAVTVYVPASTGAVYRPEVDTSPPPLETDQDTEDCVVPVTDA